MMLLSISAVLMGYTFSVKALDCDWSVVFRDCCNAVVVRANAHTCAHYSLRVITFMFIDASGCSVMMKESILKPQITFRCGFIIDYWIFP